MLKITGLETFLVPSRSVVLKIGTDEGIVGWGEPSLPGWSHSMAAMVREAGDYLIGRNPLRIEEHWQTLYRHGCYRGGPALMTVLAGIDQALWDIKGKCYGAPVHELLGGAVRDRVKVYAWVGQRDDMTIGDEAEMALQYGYSTVKMCPTEEMSYIDSMSKIRRAVSLVEEVRERVGFRLDIGVDFHGRVHKAMAKILAKELEGLRPLFLEDPILSEHVEALRDIVTHSSIPIALGERLYSRWDFKRVLSEGYVDLINPDLSNAGGISECHRIFSMAEAYDVGAAPHCPIGPIALAACLHAGAVANNVALQEQVLDLHEIDGNPQLAYVRNKAMFAIKDGYVSIPQGPGLGIDIDETALREQVELWQNWQAPYTKNEDGSVAEW